MSEGTYPFRRKTKQKQKAEGNAKMCSSLHGLFISYSPVGYTVVHCQKPMC